MFLSQKEDLFKKKFKKKIKLNKKKEIHTLENIRPDPGKTQTEIYHYKSNLSDQS